MQILFIGGMYRGLRLAERLLDRGEDVVGAFVYEEDAHESPKFSGQLASLFTSHQIWVQETRKITVDQLRVIGELRAPDVILCCGWRTLIPMGVLNCARLGGVAVHDSLLPRLRGFAPTNWGLILGHQQVGATLFQLTNSVDAGDIYFQEAIAPRPSESYDSLQQRMAEVSVRLFDQFLDAARDGTLAARNQDEARATYTCARVPADGEIDWQQSSDSIDRLIRALGSPAPGAFTYLRGSRLYVTKACRVGSPRNYEGRVAGRIVDRDPVAGTVDVLCGEGVLQIERVRTACGSEESAAAVVRSIRDTLGLDYAQEIVSLRTRLDRLESQLIHQRIAVNVDRPG
jgi:methionyl-tRNA formyltransferase